jgi:biotin synthase
VFEPTYKLLRARGKLQESLHARSSGVATSYFGRQVFLRGVVEVSNFCRENCAYCGMRRDNRSLDRFRANSEQLAQMLISHRPPSITDLNIQAGEDPVAVREIVLPLIQLLKRETSLGISVCLGTLSSPLYTALQSAGATVYIIKFESGDPDHYGMMQGPGNLKERIEHIRWLASHGWNVSSGFIVGLPQQGERELLANFKVAGDLPIAGCSISPFIAGESTPFAARPAADIELTLNCMAALRLMRPDWVIPAVSALNLAAPGIGYNRGLRTGANLVTINLTPPEVRGDYLLYKRDRFIMTEDRILSAIAAAGLEVSKQSLADFYRAKQMNRASIHFADARAIAG